jgi:hypothetical protein
MSHRVVFIPCRLDRRDALSALIEDADGWPRKVVSPLGRVGGRLVVVAQWLRETAGRHRVQFGDGTEMWVVQGPARPEDFVPIGRGPAGQRRDTAAADVPSPAVAVGLDVVVCESGS